MKSNEEIEAKKAELNWHRWQMEAQLMKLWGGTELSNEDLERAWVLTVGVRDIAAATTYISYIENDLNGLTDETLLDQIESIEEEKSRKEMEVEYLARNNMTAEDINKAVLLMREIEELDYAASVLEWISDIPARSIPRTPAQAMDVVRELLDAVGKG